MFQLNDAAWVTLRGFNLVEISWFGVDVIGSDHITIDGFKTERSRGSGIHVVGSTNVTISNNEVSWCCLGTKSVVDKNGEVVGSQECISIANGTSQFDVGYNVVHDSPVGETGGEGIDVKGGSHHGRIHHNQVTNLVRLGIYVDSYGTTHDVEIDSNEVSFTYVGIVIGSEDSHLVSAIRVHDNIVHHNGGDWAPASPSYPYKEQCGISIPEYSGVDGPRSDIAIYNNTIVSNTYKGQGAGIRVQTTSASNVAVRNNLIAGQTDGLIAASAASVTEATNNLVYPFALSTDEIEGSAAVHEPPLFENEAGHDYHLQAGSPARDSGCAGPPVAAFDADGKPRVVGPAVDIGAFEYGSGDLTPPAAPLGLSVN
jgi:parallel beta-helix repeat protein